MDIRDPDTSVKSEHCSLSLCMYDVCVSVWLSNVSEVLQHLCQTVWTWWQISVGGRYNCKNSDAVHIRKVYSSPFTSLMCIICFDTVYCIPSKSRWLHLVDFYGRSFCHILPEPIKGCSLSSFFCSNSLYLFFPLPSSPPLAFVTSPFSLVLLLFHVLLFSSTFLSSSTSLLRFLSSPVLSSPTHPSLNFIETLRRINMLSFLKANLILSPHLSHLPPPLPLQTTSTLFTFTLSLPPPVSVPHLIFPSSHQTVPHVSQIPVYVPHHAAPRLSLPLGFFFLALCHSLSHAIAAHQFLHSLTVAQHRLVQGGDEHGGKGRSYVRGTQTRLWEEERGSWRNPK